MGDGNGWSADGRNILPPDRLAAVRAVLEAVGPVVVEPWHYYGSCAPDRLVFDEFDKLMDDPTTRTRPGDAMRVRDFSQVCRDDNAPANGKVTDSQGRVPSRGADCGRHRCRPNTQH